MNTLLNRPDVTTLTHEGREYHYTGKPGNRVRDLARVYEFANVERGVERRVWARADGSEIEED